MWRRCTWCSWPQVPPSRTAPLLVRRHVREPRSGGHLGFPKSARRWGAGQLFPYKARPRGEEPGSGTPPVPATRPARAGRDPRWRWGAVMAGAWPRRARSRNGKDLRKGEAGFGVRDEGRGFASPLPGRGSGMGRLQPTIQLL